MSLVPNYSSSSESEDSDHEPPQQTKRPLSSLLPPPKKTVSISLPKLEDDEQDDLEPEQKRPKTTIGLGLAELLPTPKNYKTVTVSKRTTDKTFIPHSLSKKLKGKEKMMAPEPDVKTNSIEEAQKDKEEDEDEVEDEVEDEEEDKVLPTKKFTGSFFRLGKDLKDKESRIQPQAKPIVAASGPAYSVERPQVEPEQQEARISAVDMYAYDPNAMYSADPSVYYQYEQTNHGDSLQNGSDLEQLVGKQGRAGVNIQIKDVNQSDMLLSEEWRQAQALTAVPKFNNGVTMQASKLQMKKNNIMALAAHAVNNQEKMDEMFAANKKTRREAAKKYGF
ncbi:hypothetical protein [Parasitella parasitica]|uniref:Proline-rich protein PRCC n=1 Tax=Parasitella parasitica TaxID=35722 RepID=A0A0B7MPT6_9FUNG|nr:hypothetical protein [Parasitella parasitica]